MTIIEMLDEELNHIKKAYTNSMVIMREDATDVVIGIRFSDGKFHHILPSMERTMDIIKDIYTIHRYNLLDVTRQNFKNSILKPFINEGEFEV